MIHRADIIEAGTLGKPHGVKGEISAVPAIDADLAEARCIILDADGIFVPFFVNAVRPKGRDSVLLTIDGIDSEGKAAAWASQPFYLLRDDPAIADDEDDDDEGLYASDLIGYEVTDSEFGHLGVITDINDTTANVLFVIATPGGKELLIPVADEFIDEIAPTTRTVTSSLPESLINLNA